MLKTFATNIFKIVFQGESGNVSLIMESDHGVFKPRGLQFTGSIRARDILKVRFNLFYGSWVMKSRFG